ncbi:ABC transporter ATP-binding protein [Protofrankia symbiont of Coriaria ruscifolia]|uniref:dipeptide ABC transporter ATP-binding protein n=1 Tax=Protofrankia symbiont of Coriaria ruscifolia TaxID=1306542 RepID=UPI0010411046
MAPLLAVTDLQIDFHTAHGPVHAVRGISFTVAAGECFALVGESGSGKSATARSLVGLAGKTATVSAQRLEFEGRDLRDLNGRDWSAIRGRRIGLVFQDALVSLDPLRTVGAEVAEPLRLHRLGDGPARQARVIELLTDVGVPEPAERARQRPYELSGGLRQRALIASAIAADPGLLIADEPTTALDVTVQAQILDLLAERRAAGAGLLLISHDLAVVARLADRVAVMRDGMVVEDGPTARVLGSPQHAYTRMLLAAVPTGRQRGTRLSPAPVPAGPNSTTSTTSTKFGKAGGPAAAGVAGVAGVATDAAPANDLTPANDVVLAAVGLSRRFRLPGGSWQAAVDDVSFELRVGETLGVVGESASGKTTLARLALGLLQPHGGTVTLLGEPWSRLPERRRRTLRPRIQVVQQDPLSAFDPRYPVGRLLAEPLELLGLPRQVRRQRIPELLVQVGLDPALVTRRPRDLSGGQRQRVAIARALATGPEVLVCDEPVSALDVTVQAQILDLLVDLQREFGLAILFISHDLGVVHHLSDQVLVMKDGRVVERGPATEVFTTPRHPYTQGLLAALPRLDDALPRQFDVGAEPAAAPQPNGEPS